MVGMLERVHCHCLRGDPFYCSAAKRHALDQSLSKNQNRQVRKRSSEILPKRGEVSVVSGIFGFGKVQPVPEILLLHMLSS